MADASRHKSLARLQQVFSLLADQRLAHHQVAQQSEIHVEQVLRAHHERSQAACHTSQEINAETNLVETAVQSLAQSFHRCQITALTPVLDERRAATAACAEEHRAMCLERDRVGRIAEQMAIEIEQEEQRREQAAADERYLARRLWLTRVNADREASVRKS